MTGTTSQAAGVQLPPWLWGNNILGFAAEAQLKAHPVDLEDFQWRLEALERYEHRAPHLVRLIEVAAPGADARWDVLAGLPATTVQPKIPPQRMAELKQNLLEDTPAEDLVAKLQWFRLSLTLAPDANFVEAAQAAHEFLRNITTSAGDPFFPDLAAYFIRFDEALTKRAVLTRVLLRLAEEPTILTVPPSASPDHLVFGAGASLLNDLPLTRDAYLMPLLLSSSPFVWSLVGARQQGVMVFVLGRTMRGRGAHPSEMLQLFMPAGPTGFPAPPPMTSAQMTVTLEWWVDRLNDVLSTLTDPVTFVARDGRYDVRRHFEALLSFEQAGRRIHAILSQQRDQETRRSLAFGALDTLESLTLGFGEATTLSRAEKALDNLTAVLPADVAAVLLPAARRAVDALRGCQDGLIPSAWVAGGNVTVPDKNDQPRVLTAEEATARYLRVLRNAGHGFSGQQDKDRRRDEVLLVSHTGDIPNDFALLPFLYWLEILTDPEILRRRIASRR